MPALFLSLGVDTVVASGTVVPMATADYQEQWPTFALGVATIPRTGTYLVTARYTRAALATSPVATFSLRQNGADIIGSVRGVATNVELRGTVDALVRCVAGDTISLVGVTSSAVAQTFLAASRTLLRIVRVGPKQWT